MMREAATRKLILHQALFCAIYAAAAQLGATAAGDLQVQQAFKIQPVKHSSHNCTGDTSMRRTCVLSNVLLKDGHVFYVLPDEVYATSGFNVSDIRVSMALYHSWTGWAGQVEELTPTTVSWTAVQLLLYGSSPSTLEDAVLYQPTAFWNYGHYMGEVLPNLHMLACEHLGHCTYTDRNFTFIPWRYHQFPPMSSGKLLSCVSRHPPMQPGNPTLVKRLVVGIGPRCRGAAPYCAPGGDREPIAPASMRAVLQSYHDCLGLGSRINEQARFKQPLSVLFMNRRNLRGVPPHTVLRVVEYSRLAHNVTVLERHAEGMRIKEQARLFKDSPVTLQILGSANVNAMFQPNGSLVALATPKHFMRQAMFELGLYRDMAAAGHNITVAYISEVPIAHVHWASLLSGGSSFYKDLNDSEKMAFLRVGGCPPHLSSKCGDTGFFASQVDLPLDFMDAALGNMKRLAGMPATLQRRHRLTAFRRLLWLLP